MIRHFYILLFFLLFLPSAAFPAAFKTKLEIDSPETLRKFKTILKHYERELQKDPNNLTLTLAVAEAYYSLKDYSKSIEYYKRALALDPNNLKTQTDLAISYLANNELVLSQALLEEIVIKEPNNPNVLQGLGRIAAERNQLEEAESYYKKALEISPSHIASRYYLSELRIEQKRYLEAEKILDDLIEEDPEAPWLRHALRRAKLGPVLKNIHQLTEEGNFNLAVIKFREQLALDPENIDLYIGLANVYTQMKAQKKAIALLYNTLELYPRSEALKIALASAYIKNHEPDKAKDILKRLESQGSRNADLFAGLGQVAEVTNDFQSAENYYFKSLKINPDNLLALSFLAGLRIKQKRYLDAEKTYEHILKIDPNAEWAKQAIQDTKFASIFNDIKKQESKKNFKEAERLYMQLLVKAPHTVENYIRFAKFYHNQHNEQAAISVYLHGLDINPDSTQLQLALGFAYLEIMEYANSQELFRTVLQKNATNPHALAGLGRTFDSIGDTERAKNLYLATLAIDPNNMTALSYLADLYMDQKNYPEAKIVLTKLLKLDPTATWIKQSLLRAEYEPQLREIKKLISLGVYDEAELRLQQLLTAAPENLDAYSELGALYIRQKRIQKAIALYQKGLTTNPDANDLRVNLGLAYLENRELAEANRILQMAFVNDPRNAEAIAGLGRIATLTGDNKDAEHLYLLALKINPQNSLALSSLAELRMQQKQFQNAAGLYEALLKINPKAIWAKQALEEAKHGPLLQNIEEQELKGDLASVEHLYQELIQESPKSADYYVKLGQFYVRMMRFQDAIILYQQGLSIIPNSEQIQLALGFAYIKRGEFAVAKSTFERVLKKNPENAEALAGLGRLAEEQGELEIAKEWYEKALEKNATNLTALTYLAGLFVKKEDYKEAQKLYETLLIYNPSASWIKLAIEDTKHGRILAEIKRKEEAKDYIATDFLFQQLLLEAPDQPDYYLRAGLFYHRIKQYQKAIDTYLKGIKLAPESSTLHAALGLVYLSKKQPENAKHEFLKSLKYDPRNADALAGLGSVDILDQKFERAEKYILAALTVDPNNIAALSSLANLRMIQKRYQEAEALYVRLMELRPKEKWIKLLYQNAKYGNELDQIKDQIEAENLTLAADGYRYLITQAPDNPYYTWGLGQMYLRLKQYSNAANAFLKGLKTSPEENELLVSLGYAYLFNTDLPQARQALTKALEKDDKNPEILAGLGRVNALEEDTDQAELLYRHAYKISPINLSTLTFYGDLLMKEKRYPEAQEMFSKLKMLLPKAEWVKRILQDAEDGPLTDLAGSYSDREEFERAAELYSQLLDAAPDDPARYLPLGQMYVNIHQYYRGICIYYEGLAIDDEALYLWRAIAYAYIQLADYETARCIFMHVLSQDPKDAEAWAGLGRIEALHGSTCLAEEYYAYAHQLAPRNLTVLSLLADLRKEEQYFFSALEIYSTLMEINCRPKWIRVGYSKLLNLTFTTLGVEGAFHQEIQWDPTVNRWSAEYEVFGARGKLNYPISDILTLWGKVADEFYVLNDLLNHSTIYSFDVQRLYLGGKRVLSPCSYVEAQLGISNYSPYRKSTFDEESGVVVEPTVTLVLHQPRQRATFSLASDADLIARDFSNNEAKLVGRYFLAGTYQREVIKRGWASIEGDAYWYCDYVHNNSQRVFGSFQWRPPYYPDHIILRYQTKYQRFAKNIPDYYTYKDQFINQLQMTLEKSWRVCWADSLYTSLSYGHGWQDTYTRFGQIIVVTPVGVQPPLFWDRRQFNILFGNIIYTYDQLELNLNADYYRDTQKYTMWSVVGGVKWRF